MKSKSKFQSVMINTTIIFFVALIVFIVLYKMLKLDVFFTLAVVAFTTFYHFAVRLAIGAAIEAIFHNKLDYRKRWFQPKLFEAGLYKKLKVKRWKHKLPTYNPEVFSVKQHSIEEIAAATCQSEIVHELNVAASFVPLLFALAVGDFPVFLITSVTAACYDMIFVIMQRYNRPRLIKLIQK